MRRRGVRRARPGLPTRYEFTVCAERPGAVPTLAGYDMAVRERPDGARDRRHGRDPRLAAPDNPPAPPCSTRCGGPTGAGPASSPSAPAPSCWPSRACSTAAGRPPTGGWPPSWPPGSPACRSRPTASTSTWATSRPAPAPPRASTCACTWSAPTTAPPTPTQVARHMVMPPHREGGQLQYAVASRPGALRLPGPGARLGRRTTARTAHRRRPRRPGRGLPADARPQVRRPARYQPGPVAAPASGSRRRGRCWRRPICRSRRSRRVGLSSATNLRRRFHHTVRTTPAAYRRSFGSHHEGEAALQAGDAQQP